jgi:hypothetical protein
MRLFLLPCVVLIFALPGRTEDLTLRIPPVKTSLDVKGQAIQITAWGTVSPSAADRFKLALTADLGELQGNITAVLAAELNRSDRCGERLEVQHASLAPAAPSALLTANVHYEHWACAKVFGKEVVKRVVGGNGVITVKLTPSVAADGIGMASEVQKIDADGSLGELLRSGSLGNTVKEKIANSVQSAIRKGLDLKSTLPAGMQGAATFQSAQFSSSADGRLLISVAGETTRLR